MNITIITTYFYPEDTAIGLYTTQLAESLTKKNHNVTVITGFPNYPQWELHKNYKGKPKFYSEGYNKIKILRYNHFNAGNVNITRRVKMMLRLSYGTFKNIKNIDAADVVICIIPYTLLAIPARMLAKKKKARLWIHVQDLEFDLAKESGILKNNFLSKILNYFLKLFEKNILTAADVVSSISYNMVRKITLKINDHHVYLLPNWVSQENINPEKAMQHAYISKEKYTLLYSGNIGEKQDWDLLINLCDLIKNCPDEIVIVIVGDGAYYKTLKERCKDFSFVKFYPPVPYKDLQDLLCSADTHFLFQKNDVVDTIMPSKILGMMASGKPSVITGNTNSEVATIINLSQGEGYIASHEPKEVLDMILKLKNDKLLALQMGKSAQKYIIENFSEEQILTEFEKKLTTL